MSSAYTGPIGLQFLDRPSISEQLQLVAKVERLGYSSAWVAETRLTRDAVSVLAAFATVTDSIRLGAAVVNSWTRGPVLMAMTFATLHEMAPGRVALGLGTYSDPIAANQGVRRSRPLRQLTEYVEVVRRLFALEGPVSLEGELVHVRDVELDLGHGVSRNPIPVPIYIGATGPATLRLAGQISDGVLLNGFMASRYTRKAVRWVQEGAQAAGRAQHVECAQLINVAMSPDRGEAFEIAHLMATMYLGGQPHIARAAGLDPELADALASAVGGWPPRAADVRSARRMVSPELVEELVLVGTADECRARLGEWVDAGADYPIISPLSGDVASLCEALAPG
jgi:5,10-methylenetetrahydromethanopterin reductase